MLIYMSTFPNSLHLHLIPANVNVKHTTKSQLKVRWDVLNHSDRFVFLQHQISPSFFSFPWRSISLVSGMFVFYCHDNMNSVSDLTLKLEYMMRSCSDKIVLCMLMSEFLVWGFNPFIAPCLEIRYDSMTVLVLVWHQSVLIILRDIQ